MCHQLPQRTINVGYNLLPVCARCTGIYFGLIVSLVYLLLRNRWKGNKIPDLSVVIVAAFSFLPFMIDGAGSYIGLWKTNNIIRIITGIFAGYAIPIFIILIMNFEIKGKNKNTIIKDYKELILILCICLFGAFLIYNSFFGYIISSLIISCGIIFMYTSILAIIIRAFFNKLSIKTIYLIAFIIGILIISLISKVKI